MLPSGRLQTFEMAPNLYLLEGFGNVGVAVTGEGVVIIDTSSPNNTTLLSRLRDITQEPVRYIIYTHGHGDHAANATPFLQEAAQRGDPRPAIIAHTNVVQRMNRYAELHEQQDFINRIQFRIPPQMPAFPANRLFVRPDVTYDTSMRFHIGSLTFELHHAMGETDDITWVSIPERKAIFSGDLLISSCPNIGNPLKVQRYEVEWADALEQMAALHADVLGPGHGGVVRGAELEDTLLTTARALRYLHNEVVRRMNQGQWEEQIVNEVTLPPDLATHPALAPIYGCPMFVVRGIYRRYAGWYDGNPSHLLPSRTAAIAQEILALTGVEPLLQRVEQLSQDGDQQKALHLIDVVIDGTKDTVLRNRALLIKSELLDKLAAVETSFISRSIMTVSAERMRAEIGEEDHAEKQE